MPTLDLTLDDVSRVFVGCLPAQDPEGPEPASRDILIDHGSLGGRAGLYSICGAKFTTARALADRTLSTILPSCERSSAITGQPPDWPDHPDYGFFDELSPGDPLWRDPLRQAIESEAVVHLDDLMLRRSALGDNPERALALASEVCKLFSWDDGRRLAEIERLRGSLFAGLATAGVHGRDG